MATHDRHDEMEHAEADGVITVTLPVSEDGLLSLSTCDQLTDILLSPPDSASVIVIRSNGTQFCAGRERTAASVDDLPREVDRLAAVNHALRSSQLVSIAAVHGDAAGFGVGLAALSDFAIASPETEFSFPEVGIGLAPVLVLAWLPQLVGRREAFRLTASGSRITAQRALELGLVSQVTAGAGLDADIEALALEMRRRSPRVLSEIRDFLRVSDQSTEAEATELARARLVVGSLRRGD